MAPPFRGRMTELEHEFLLGLITAAWPLSAQIAFGVALVAGYWAWSRLYYAAIDPALRRLVGRTLGARVVWVRRGSAAYPSLYEFGQGRSVIRRWMWGIEPASERTLRNDAATGTLSFFIVTIIGGLWPIALFFFVFLYLKALSYVVFLPVCLAVLAIYSRFWDGRHEVQGMR
jgi:VIT1/CCC1 family predicted Fe2+/Mn2+ transporter